ncbi:MAG: 30S ribosomal protein S20 [Candidatus Buchananbacteria bacterium]|nr:30S ribosomal protein S20 [Candidatus Buchananbacteria bacterium]
MPIKKAAEKALRQSTKRANKNKKIDSDIDALVRKVKKAIAAGDQAKASEFLKQAIKKIDKAQQKSALKKNTAARKKSRLARSVNSIAKK